MLFTVIFKAEYGSYYEGVRVEADSDLQAAVNAARRSKYTKLVSLNEEKGLLEHGDKYIPTCYKGTSIPFVALYEKGDIKMSTLEIPFSLDERSEEVKLTEENYVLALRNLLLRKEWSENGGKTPPNHILVGETHVEIGIIDCYDGWDNDIQPFHMLKFK